MNAIHITVFALTILLAAGFMVILQSVQIPGRIKKAEELFRSGNESGASDIVKRILERKKDYVPARYLRARLLFNQKQYLLAISEFNAILQIPEFTKFVKELDIHTSLAELYSLTQQWHREVEEYKMILSFDPENVHANHRVGITFYRQSRYRDARDALMKAVARAPELWDCFLPLGISCYNLAEYTNAEEFLLKAAEHPQQNGMEDGYFYLGLIYKGKKDYDAAIRMFENARRDKKLYVKSQFKIGEIYFDTDNYDKAISVLEEGLGSLKPREEDSLAFRYLLAECYEMENKVQEAVHHWEKIQSEHPSYKNTPMKLDEYKSIVNDESMKTIFTSSIDDIQPILAEVISRLNYNVISKTIINSAQLYFKAYNTKRINEPPILIFFVRTTREVSESQIQRFSGLLADEKCKTGIFISTSRFSPKARTAATSKGIEIHDRDIIIKTLGKYKGKV
jgi:tetratricopeptide (TPR) repeat protein